jgi:hypothetical protein
MDPYDGEVLGKPFDPRWDPVRRSLGYTLRFARRMDLAAARPAADVASTKYCLAVPGKQYLVYKPGDAGEAVTVKMGSGAYRFEWFDPATGRQVSTGTRDVTGPDAQFPCPVQHDAVLFVTHVKP